MDSRPRVVITGVGVVSPLGIGPEAFWESLCQQRSGVDVLPAVAALDLPLRIGAAVKDFDPKQYVKPRKALKVMSREIQMGFAAASMAVEHAGWQPGQLPPDRTGVLFASDMLYCEPTESVSAYGHCTENGKFHAEQWGGVFMSELYPLWMLMYLPNMVACHIGIAHDARGPNNTICQGEASSLLALIEAAGIIERGHADVMITGGSSSRMTATSMLYRGMDRLSHRIDSPQSACRPFDATRDGAVNGEGAAAFVLEREEFATARGAKILARVAGWGMAFAPPSGTRSRRARRFNVPSRKCWKHLSGQPRTWATSTPTRPAPCQAMRPKRRRFAPCWATCQSRRPRATSAISAPAVARWKWLPACWHSHTATSPPHSTTLVRIRPAR